nr:fatty acid desaturase [Parvularcula sp. IMCC14364]
MTDRVRISILFAGKPAYDISGLNGVVLPMTIQEMPETTPSTENRITRASDWMPVLARYREPGLGRSLFELAVTFIPFVLLWAMAVWSLQVGYWLTLLVALPTAGFLVRLFIIQHDCGHGAYFRQKWLNGWVGRCIGVLTATPYFVWHRAHAQHHAAAGNLDNRGIGAVHTLTVEEYQAKSWSGRLSYRVFRSPLVLFGIGPAYVFLLQNRLPLEFLNGGWRYWVSAMGTNLMMLLVASGVIWLIGWQAFLAVFLPVMLFAASIGVWLFYVQHQFEDTHWSRHEDWQIHHAALHGSSHYDLPQPLQWITGNIGIHHVHHLNARIPFYRLPKVLKDHPALASIKRLTLWQSLKSINLHLWCETRQRLVSFREAKLAAA